MIHMLSSFDLKPLETLEDLERAYKAFTDDLHDAGVVAETGPVGERVSDTPMDTDDAHSQQLFSIMSFRDREQLDAAYAFISQKRQPGATSHLSMYRRITNSTFLCWEDRPAPSS